ncbi:hypothetical protein [Actinophytocola sp.]|uniref:hypothetical protein n=1 Tax=Actinophytocola sp. TaxID=1872138 RepID=UPI003D6BCD86
MASFKAPAPITKTHARRRRADHLRFGILPAQPYSAHRRRRDQACGLGEPFRDNTPVFGITPAESADPDGQRAHGDLRVPGDVRAKDTAAVEPATQLHRDPPQLLGSLAMELDHGTVLADPPKGIVRLAPRRSASSRSNPDPSVDRLSCETVTIARAAPVPNLVQSDISSQSAPPAEARPGPANMDISGAIPAALVLDLLGGARATRLTSILAVS